jgi:hypothetical protein
LPEPTREDLVAITRHTADETGSDALAGERERPEDWGWHHEWRRSAPVIGWVMTISMALLVFGNHQGNTETWWLLGLAAAMAALLVRDRIKRKNAWRA